MDVALKRIYYGNNIGALRGPIALLEQARAEGVVGVSLEACKEFLKGEPTYTVYKPARRNYERNHIIATSPGSVVQIDIMDMTRFKHANRHSYVLLSYDSYSKFLMGVPLKNRSEAAVDDGLKSLINSAPYSFIRIYWDKEGSFLSNRVQESLGRFGISNYTTASKVKAPGVERSIRTIRNAVQRHFVSSKTLKWEQYVQEFISYYNNRVHSTTRVKPVDVLSDLSVIPRNPKQPRIKKWKIPSVGSYVRLNRLRGLFDKEASGSFTEEVFKVILVRRKNPIPLIYVEDLLGKAIKGGLYPEEYQSVRWDPEPKVDKIFKRRKLKNAVNEVYASFKGYPDKYRAWVPLPN